MPVISAPCIVAMPIPFSIKMIGALVLGYFVEWLFERFDDDQ